MKRRSIFHGKYACDVLRISDARLEVVRALEGSCRLTKQKRVDFEIALGELLQNIARHETCAVPPCHLFIDLEVSGTDLCVTASDTCDLLQDLTFLDVQRVATESGGMGVNLIKSISTKYLINTEEGVNKHTLIFEDFLTPT